jgi:uncharacterized protein (TIGR02596 family)
MTRRAFSLIEVLVVVTILAIVATFTMPSVNSVLRGTALSSAEDELAAELGLARQHAVASNREVEIRFYYYSDPSAPGTPQARFQAYQIFSYDETGQATPAGRLKKLSPRVILASNESLSTLLGPAQKKSWAGETKPSLPGIGTSYEAHAFRFRPDGGTSLTPFPAVPWYVTLHDATAGDGLTTPPPNFASLGLDAANGHISRFRP